MNTRVYVLYGGLIGPDGAIPGVNLGMYLLSRQIAKLPNVEVTTHLWNTWQSVAQDIKVLPGFNRVVLVGFSGGGSRSTYIANNVNQLPIDLIVAYDPSPKWQCVDLDKNVKRAVCYHNNWPLMFGLGGGRLVEKVDTVEISQQHMLVQFNQTLHDRTLREIRSLNP